MSRPKLVRIRRAKGVVVQDCDVYIGRRQTQGGWNLQESEWHNPFSLKKYGERAIPLFREHLHKLLADDPETWIPKLLELKGKTLGCWCKPGPCHGDIIADLVVKLLEAMDDSSKLEALMNEIYIE